MAKTEFEEPEYEGPLYNQLLSGNLGIWTPGRVFERIVGIDSAVLANNQYFWTLFAQASRQGVNLRNYNWHSLWHLMSRTVRPFPKFKVNLLIQAKRPSHESRVNSSYCAKGICGEHWFFKTTLHQQAILEKLEQKLGSDALVLYACPAFHKFDTLDHYIETGQIVENSTFVKPMTLKNHSKWVFDSPGTVGLACSEISEHSDKPFFEMYNNLRERRYNYKSKENNLKFLYNIILDICDELIDNPITKAFLKRNIRLIEYFEQIKNEFNSNQEDNYTDFINFMSVSQFMATSKINWYTIE